VGAGVGAGVGSGVGSGVGAGVGSAGVSETGGLAGGSSESAINEYPAMPINRLIVIRHAVNRSMERRRMPSLSLDKKLSLSMYRNLPIKLDLFTLLKR
jgi:hypothetical protein